ncbi:MAG: SDR family oxidoreductase [Gammaproteobacteria bacterium]
MAKVLIAGCGDIGHRLAELLARQGHQVVGLKRNPPVSDSDHLGYFKADITRPGDLMSLDTDFDLIFFMPTPDYRDVEAYRRVYQLGLSNLITRFAGQGSRPHWFFISSTSVYGQANGEWVDEQSPAEPQTESGTIIRRAEQLLYADDPGHVVVRFSGIYGPGRERLLKMSVQTPVIQYDPPYFTNRIHQDDCAAVLAFLSEQRLTGRPLEACYLASDDTPAPLWDVMTWLAKQMRCPPPIPESRSTRSQSQNKRCRNQRLKQLGYRFIYPSYQEGYLPLVGNEFT